MDEMEIPDWVTSLLTEKFFNSCLIHDQQQKNDKTVLCLDCCQGICHFCLLHHTSHRLLKIRRYVYLDVVRVIDGEKVMDCSKIQPYVTNGAKVVFLKQKPFSRSPSVNAKLCLTCHRSVHEPYLYCSICCKVEYLLETGCNLLECFCKSECVVEPGIEDGQMTPDSVLETTGSVRTESGEMGGTGLMDCTATTVVKKKRTSVFRARSYTKPVCVSASDVPETKLICEPVCVSATDVSETKLICEPVCEISETEPVNGVLETKPVCRRVREVSEQGVFVNKRKGMPRRSPFV